MSLYHHSITELAKSNNRKTTLTLPGTMIKKLLIGTIIIFFATLSFAENIVLAKKDYLTLIVSNYVHGFKEFETSVSCFDDSVSVGVYYDILTQSEERAKELANRFRTHIPLQLSSYDWAKNTKVIVNVYSEDRTKRGY